MSSTGPARRADLLVALRSMLSVRVPAVVWFLGLTSFLTDVSSEMIVSTLPGFLVLHLGVSPFAYGVIDGLYHGLTGVARLMSGFVADRTRRYKETAFLGYAVSAVCKMLLVAAPGPQAIGAIIAVDRLGKGIRTAPRDALVGLSVDRAALGQAFGVHRALDTAGAALGPLCAFLILSTSREAYDAVFVVSFAFAVAGLAALGLFVRNPPNVAAGPSRSTSVAFRALLGMRQYRAVLLSASALSVVTVSDGLLYLAIAPAIDPPTTVLPLYFTLTALVFFALAIPFGRAADRFGRVPIFLAGYVFLLAAYLIALQWHWARIDLLLVAALGGYYAATDGVLAALVSAALPAEIRASGLAGVSTCTAIGRLLASSAFGYLWMFVPPQRLLPYVAAALAAAIVFSALQLRQLSRE